MRRPPALLEPLSYSFMPTAPWDRPLISSAAPEAWIKVAGLVPVVPPKACRPGPVPRDSPLSVSAEPALLAGSATRSVLPS